MTEMSKIDTGALLAEATAFIWAEGAMLDACAYDDWLALWDPKGFYVMPIEDSEDFADNINLAYDNDKMRRDRIGRFQAGFSISSAPPAQTVRTLSRFTLDAAEGDEITVSCAEHLVEDKFGRQRMWAANVRYRLVRDGAGFRIREKVIRLLNANGMLNSFSYLF